MFSGLLFCPREIKLVLVFHRFAADMGINLGRIDRLVAEQFLDQTKVSPTLQKMGGESMAEFMGMKPDMVTGFVFDFFENVFESPDRKGFALGREKILIAFEVGFAFGEKVIAEALVVDEHRFFGGLRKGNEPFLPPFAENPNHPVVVIDLAVGEGT